ncbi:MAG TPA: ShlB/FhaC/HecB family hemolysin secretion/activation protein [Nevskiaceae bacterium]|nr:ShlB/FhaC/HecB family hemolysin secretion/activation protein [Nevskiaceae bacterium]
MGSRLLLLVMVSVGALSFARAACAQLPAPADVVDQARSAGGDERVTVQSFEFSGNTVYPASVLMPLLVTYLNRPLSLEELYAAADAVTAYYRMHGYTLAAVQLPAQDISSGKVQLEVVEGRVGGVAVTGAHRYDPAELLRTLDLPRGSVYRGDTLERGLFRLNDLPGLSARAVLQPGADFGTSDVIVNVDERLLAGALSVDNYGRKNIGEFRVGGTGTLDNPLGVADQLQLIALHAEADLLNYGYGEYSLPLTTAGQRVAVSYGKALFKVTSAGIAGDNSKFRTGVRWPLAHTRADNFLLNFGGSYTHANADLSGLSISDTRITLFDASLLYSHRYDNSAASQAQLSLGTDLRRQTRADLLSDGVRHERARIELDAQHLQPLWPRGLALWARVDGVWSPDPLADTEQFAIGGPDSVRAYPASEVRGDRGYQGSLGLQQLFRFGPVDLQLREFADAGEAYVVHPLPGTDSKTSLAGYGIGFDLHWRMLSFKLDGARPIHARPSSDGRDSGRLFGAIAVAY